VQVGLGGVYHGVLKIVQAHTYLALDLLLGSTQLLGGEGVLHELLQLLLAQVQAVVHIVGIAAVVDAEHAGIRITAQVALHGVHQAAALPEAQVQAAVHAGTA